MPAAMRPVRHGDSGGTVTGRIIAGLLSVILTASFLVLPSLSRGFNEPMIVKVFYFFVVDDSPPEE
jgi:hypothetical protein